MRVSARTYQVTPAGREVCRAGNFGDAETENEGDRWDFRTELGVHRVSDGLCW